VSVPPLSRSELGRLFLRLPALRDLEAEDRRAVMGTIGGHPRLIEFVDAILRGRANLVDVANRLRRLAREHGISLAPGRGVSDAVNDAVVLGSRDVLLEELWETLDPEERELALQAAVAREPFTVEELALARWFPDVAEERATATAMAILERLAAADPRSAAAQRDLGVSCDKFGDLMLRVGNGAEEHWRSIDISRRWTRPTSRLNRTSTSPSSVSAIC
jgi:hypothetical protein